MKKCIKIISIFCAAVIVFSCQKQYSVFDETSINTSVYVAIDGAPTSVLFYFNQPTSSYKTNMLQHGALTITKMDAYVVVGGVETLVKTITFPNTAYEVTLQEVATALNVAVDTFVPGAKVVLRNKLTTSDGQVFSGANTSNLSGGLLAGAAYQNLLNDVTVFVTCPFVADDAVGSYTVVRDDWEDVFPGDVVTVDKIDATNIIINEYPTTAREHHG